MPKKGIYSEKDRKYMIGWRERNKDKILSYTKKQRTEIRRKVLSAYGGEEPSCKCCGIKVKELLCIDHINGGGNKERLKLFAKKRNPAGNAFYYWLIQASFPPGYQLLCHNCNYFKAKYPLMICPCKAEIDKAKSERIVCFVENCDSTVNPLVFCVKHLEERQSQAIHAAMLKLKEEIKNYGSDGDLEGHLLKFIHSQISEN